MYYLSGVLGSSRFVTLVECWLQGPNANTFLWELIPYGDDLYGIIMTTEFISNKTTIPINRASRAISSIGKKWYAAFIFPETSGISTTGKAGGVKNVKLEYLIRPLFQIW